MTLPRYLIGLFLCGVLLAPSPAAEDKGQPADLFDFWVGDWDARWKNQDGTDGRGRNLITKVLDGAVLEEQFEAEGTEKAPGLKGRSLSVRHKGSGVWKQSWADNQGGFYEFTATADGERRMFVTAPVTRDGKEVIQRMVFFDIKKDSFAWDWESTTDGGKTWKRLWRIEYTRRPEVRDRTKWPEDWGARKAIDIATSRLRDAMNERDVKKCLSVYTDDATVVSGGRVWKTKGEREERVKAWAAEVKDLTLEVDDIEVRGGLAVVDGGYTATLREGGRKVAGKYLSVWKKQTDGAWKLHAETLSPEPTK